MESGISELITRCSFHPGNGCLQIATLVEKIMAIVEFLRHNLTSFVIWCVFLALYLGGALLLVMGLVFAARPWWALIHQHAGLWALTVKTTELFVMAAGFFLILIIPILQRRAGHRVGSWRAERRSETKSRFPCVE